jgi:hypothetical protein
MSSDHGLVAVGKPFDPSRERMRQVEAKAPRKLEHPGRAAKRRSCTEALCGSPSTDDERGAHHAIGLRTISKTFAASSVRACCWIWGSACGCSCLALTSRS